MMKVLPIIVHSSKMASKQNRLETRNAFTFDLEQENRRLQILKYLSILLLKYSLCFPGKNNILPAPPITHKKK